MRTLLPRCLGLALVLAMLGFVWIGVLSVRRDLASLRSMSQENIIWTANQVENELMRLRLSLAMLIREQTPEAVERVRQRYDILLSRTVVHDRGRVGQALRDYAGDGQAVEDLARFLSEIEPLVETLGPQDSTSAARLLEQLEAYQQATRLYTLQVVRGQSQRFLELRERVLTSGQITAAISLAAVLVSLLALLLILRENRRQQQIAELNRQSAEQAELSSRAKSRFLAMVSHELRNPLHGVLGPLALLRGQPDLAPPQRHLVERAKQSGEAIVQLLSSLLDYGEMQDGRLPVRVESMRPAVLAEGVAVALCDTGAGFVDVRVEPGTPEVVIGDIDRFRQIFVALVQYIREAASPASLELVLGHAEQALVGEVRFRDPARRGNWRLHLEKDWSPGVADQVPSEALRPIIVQGLVAALGGTLELTPDEGVIRVRLPARQVREGRVRVHLETRSAALATIYRSALRSEQVAFADKGGQADVVLVDATTVGEHPLMHCLRQRFPGAVFVSLGAPDSPELFDAILEAPADMSRLRDAVLGQLAS